MGDIVKPYDYWGHCLKDYNDFAESIRCLTIAFKELRQVMPKKRGGLIRNEDNHDNPHV